jgi:hypothetical protein
VTMTTFVMDQPTRVESMVDACARAARTSATVTPNTQPRSKKTLNPIATRRSARHRTRRASTMGTARRKTKSRSARVTQGAIRATDARTTRATRTRAKVAARAAWTRAGGSVNAHQHSQAPAARLISVNRHRASTAPRGAAHLAGPPVEASHAHAFLAGVGHRAKAIRSAHPPCTPPPAKIAAVASTKLARPCIVTAPLITRVTAARGRSAQTTHANMVGPAHRRIDRRTARVIQQATWATDARTTRAPRARAKVAARAAWTRMGGYVTAQQDSQTLSARQMSAPPTLARRMAMSKASATRAQSQPGTVARAIMAGQKRKRAAAHARTLMSASLTTPAVTTTQRALTRMARSTAQPAG